MPLRMCDPFAVWVGCLPHGVSKGVVGSLFLELDICPTKIVVKHRGRTADNLDSSAIVSFASENDVKKAISLHKFRWDNERTLVVRNAFVNTTPSQDTASSSSWLPPPPPLPDTAISARGAPRPPSFPPPEHLLKRHRPPEAERQ